MAIAEENRKTSKQIGRLSADEIPTKDTVMKNLNISVEEEERTAQYFKFLLNKETDRLKEISAEIFLIELRDLIRKSSQQIVTKKSLGINIHVEAVKINLLKFDN
ncbi:disks large-associated protein 5 [Lasius niger]|uniref:Disks large-associated protein 5 n=1 Tax=Lasius niger TaxID=67767 RepID=A0A0J7MW12_LASNI|nr:disks large-associated protein 5 [Lasius niger]